MSPAEMEYRAYDVVFRGNDFEEIRGRIHGYSTRISAFFSTVITTRSATGRDAIIAAICRARRFEKFSRIENMSMKRCASFSQTDLTEEAQNLVDSGLKSRAAASGAFSDRFKIHFQRQSAFSRLYVKISRWKKSVKSETAGICRNRRVEITKSVLRAKDFILTTSSGGTKFF